MTSHFVGTTTLSIRAFSIVRFSIMQLSIMTFSIMTLSATINTQHNSRLLSVVNKPFVLSVTMLNVLMCVVAPLDSLRTHYFVAIFSKNCIKYCQLRANHYQTGATSPML
jgi:hypothetical protein